MIPLPWAEYNRLNWGPESVDSWVYCVMFSLKISSDHKIRMKLFLFVRTSYYQNSNTGFYPRPTPVGFVVYKMTLTQVFPPNTFRYSLWVSSHQFSVVILHSFILISSEHHLSNWKRRATGQIFVWSSHRHIVGLQRQRKITTCKCGNVTNAYVRRASCSVLFTTLLQVM